MKLPLVPILVTLAASAGFMLFVWNVNDREAADLGLTAFAALLLIAMAWIVWWQRRTLRAQQAAEESRQRHASMLQAMIESVAEGVVVADSAGRFIFFNRAAERMLGLGAAGIPPDQWSEHYHVHRPGEEALCPTEDLPLVRALRGEQVDDVELELAPKDADARLSIACSARPVRGPDGESLGGVVVFRDASMRKQIEQARDQRQTNLTRAERVRALGEITAGLAHELNQPLCAAINYSRALQRVIASDAADASVVLEILARISQEAERCGQIMQRIQRLARQESASAAEPADINDIARDVVRLMQPSIRAAGVQIELCLDETDSLVRGDEIQVEQVLINFVRNALDALANQPSGRRLVRITTNAANADAVRVIVEDTGPGVPPADRERIFDAFHSTKTDGMGMGLTISRTIVEQFGGRVGIGEGTLPGAAFWFTIPKARRGKS